MYSCFLLWYLRRYKTRLWYASTFLIGIVELAADTRSSLYSCYICQSKRNMEGTSRCIQVRRPSVRAGAYGCHADRCTADHVVPARYRAVEPARHCGGLESCSFFQRYKLHQIMDILHQLSFTIYWDWEWRHLVIYNILLPNFWSVACRSWIP